MLSQGFRGSEFHTADGDLAAVCHVLNTHREVESEDERPFTSPRHVENDWDPFRHEGLAHLHKSEIEFRDAGMGTDEATDLFAG